MRSSMQPAEIAAVKSPVRAFACERLDAYWFAEMFRARARQVAADANCKSTIGRALDSALGRVIRYIAEAAGGTRERATAFLARARAALNVVVTHVNALRLERRARAVVVADLREHALDLLERLQMLDREPVETWPMSNCLPTVLDDVKNDSGVDVTAAIEKLPAAAFDKLPDPVVAEGETTHQPPNGEGVASERLAKRDKTEATTN